MSKKRKQLTLFINREDSAAIEKIREKYNPGQYHLIKSHVTLCRENELTSIKKVIENLSASDHHSIAIHFGAARRFAEGKGVLIPATSDNDEFQELRKIILSGIIDSPGKHEPHITLMHPRNSTCTDRVFEKIQSIHFPRILTFNKISLIEQEDEKPWTIIKEYMLIKKE
jgi:hypothetical protein